MKQTKKTGIKVFVRKINEKHLKSAKNVENRNTVFQLAFSCAQYPKASQKKQQKNG